MIKIKWQLLYSSAAKSEKTCDSSADLLKIASQLDEENEYTLVYVDAQIIINEVAKKKKKTRMLYKHREDFLPSEVQSSAGSGTRGPAAAAAGRTEQPP